MTHRLYGAGTEIVATDQRHHLRAIADYWHDAEWDPELAVLLPALVDVVDAADELLATLTGDNIARLRATRDALYTRIEEVK